MNAMLRCARGENSSMLLDRCKCLEHVCADGAARPTLVNTHDHQQLLSTDTSERTRKATNMSAATVISFPMNSTKTARYHDATNDTLYLNFFMVFPKKCAKTAQHKDATKLRRLGQTHLKPNPPGAVAIQKVAFHEKDLADIAQTHLKAMSVKVENQKRQQPET